MPVYKSHTVFELIRGIKAFVSLRAGVTRGQVPDFKAPAGVLAEAPDAAARQAAAQIERQRKTLETQRRQIEQQRKQLSNKDRRIAELQKRLAGVRAERSENVVLDGVVLPPKSMRPCGPNFQDDGFYLESAKKEADRLVEDLGLTRESSLLDVGSGPGRLAIGILQRVGEIRAYRGVDVAERSVRWGESHITSDHPSFQFLHIDVENTRYNPDGAASDSDFTFPFGDKEFDIITLYSVFTHMLTDGVRTYLKEFDRILLPDGRLYLTAFVEDDVPDVEENPEGYLGREWKGPLHCVRYDREFFEKLLEESGFRLDGFDTTRGKAQSSVLEQGQRGLYISRRES